MSDNYGKSSRPNNGLHSNCRCYTLSSFGRYVEGIGTLRANGGDAGGGSEVLVIQRRFSNVLVENVDVSPTIEAGGAKVGTICR